MVIREPNLYDLYAATLLVTEKEDAREVVLLNWLEMRKNPLYTTKVFIHKKKVHAFLIVGAHLMGDDDVLHIVVFLGDRDAKSKLLKKFLKEELNHNLRFTTTENLEDLKFLGFKIKSYNLELKGSVK